MRNAGRRGSVSVARHKLALQDHEYGEAYSTSRAKHSGWQVWEVQMDEICRRNKTRYSIRLVSLDTNSEQLSVSQCSNNFVENSDKLQ